MEEQLKQALGGLLITNIGLIVTLLVCTWRFSSVMTRIQVHVDILMREHDRRVARAEGGLDD